MVIMGIDPGIKNTGIAVLNTDEKGMDCGTLKPQDLGDLHKQIIGILIKVKPHLVAIEGAILGFSKSPSSHLEAFGVIVAVLQTLKIPYQELTPPEWKKILFGKGIISKTEIHKMMREKVKGIKEHEMDAICLIFAYMKKNL